MRKFIFDLDGTLTACETLPYIAKYFQVAEELKELTEKTVQGELDFVFSIKKRVGLLSFCPVNEVADLLCSVPIFEGIRSFIRIYAHECIIASSNLDCWVTPLLQSFGCSFYTSKAFVQNNRVHGIEYILEKQDIVKKFQGLGFEVVFIGEGNNDLQAMVQADIKIACGLVHNPAVCIAECADYFVRTEDEFLQLLEKLHDRQK